jgi:hypothetical protein
MCIDINQFFAKNIPHNLICPIGGGVMVERVGLLCSHKSSPKKFMHIFCESCYLQCNTKKCPICNCKIDNNVVYLESNEEINDLELKCIHEKCNWTGKIHEKCNWTGKYINYNSHITECDYQEIKCKYCKKSILKIDSKNHLEFECEERLSDCKFCNSQYKAKYKSIHEQKIRCNSCNLDLIKCSLDKHYEECQELEIDCEFMCCNEKYKRKEKEKHNIEFSIIHTQNLNNIIVSLCKNNSLYKDFFTKKKKTNNLEKYEQRENCNDDTWSLLPFHK